MSFTASLHGLKGLVVRSSALSGTEPADALLPHGAPSWPV